MRDLLTEIAETAREVARRGGGEDELVAVTVRREYPAAVDDVWTAVTDPARLARWFAPVTGDLRAGGTFAVEGNADGEIRACSPPSTLVLTWGAPVSVVTVRLTAAGGATLLELEHTVPVAFAGSGAGALFVGPGWDVALLGLGLHLRGEDVGDPVAWEGGEEVRRAGAASIDAWVATVTASGTATPEEVAGGEVAARAQFTPEPTAG
ncbi:SRPBCC family protein [Geodermatophilus amargosae]|uniref:SRPBCC family protein n=1 Tax=Geodermatophilus amargosae TaxID=1296565 RepID=UPI0034DFD9DE